MKKILFSFLLVLSFFFFNLDSSFAANIVEQNTMSISESIYKEYNLNMNEKISSSKKVKRVADTIILTMVNEDGSVIIIIIK